MRPVALQALGWALAASTGLASAETIPIPFETRRIPKPEVRDPGGTLPRSILLVGTKETLEDPDSGEDPDESDRKFVTHFQSFDPRETDNLVSGFFQGPGGGQRLRFLTPLFGGWGIAYGSLDPECEPKEEADLFWFNPLEGRKGRIIAESLELLPGIWIGGTELRFLAHGAPKGTRKRDDDWSVFRFDLRSEILSVSRDRYTAPHRIAEDTILAYVGLVMEFEIVRLRIGAGKTDFLGPAPEPLRHLRAAGPFGEEGLFYVEGKLDGWSLHWKAPGKPWVVTASKVLIEKLQGGEAPFFSVFYVGDGRFAYPETIAGSVKRRGDFFDVGLSRTILVEARTGRILDSTPPKEYDYNPVCEIPDSWWAPGFDRKSVWIQRGFYGNDPSPPPPPGDVPWLENGENPRRSPDGIFEVSCNPGIPLNTPNNCRDFRLKNLQAGTVRWLLFPTRPAHLSCFQWLLLCGPQVREEDLALWARQR